MSGRDVGAKLRWRRAFATLARAAAAPLSGTSDGALRGDLRWSGREGAPRCVCEWVELVKYQTRAPGFAVAEDSLNSMSSK